MKLKFFILFLCAFTTDGIGRTDILRIPVTGISRQEEQVNVLDFGVKADGVTDNTSRLSVLLKKYRKLYFPKGTYLIKYLKVDEADVQIVGAGIDQTIFRSTAKSNDHTLILNSNAALSDLTIDGGGDRMPKPLRGDGASCLNISPDATQVKINRVKFINSYNKQVIVLGSSVIFNDCIFKGGTNTNRNIDGVHVYGGVNKVGNVQINRCKFYNHIRAGVYTDLNVNGVSVNNAYFYNLDSNYEGGSAIILQGGASNINIINNQFLGYKRGVIIRNGASDIIINNNKFNKIYSNGIFISTSSNLDRILRKEDVFVKYKMNVEKKSSGRFNYSFDNIQIGGNEITFAKFKGKILEPRTASFILVGGDANNIKTKFSNIKVSKCIVRNNIIGVKSFMFSIILGSDVLDGVSILDCTKPNDLKMFDWYMDSKNRAINLQANN